MHLKVHLRPTQWGEHCGLQSGSFEWESSTGRIAGALGERIVTEAKRAARAGGIDILPPPGGFVLPISYPIRNPCQMAHLLVSLDYRVPSSLVRYLKRFPDPLKGMTRAQRRVVVF
jgi:hypothetical protein